MKPLPHYLLPLLLLMASACKKEQTELEKLPAATQSGANTAGCLIDGHAFVATGWGSGMGKVPGVKVGLARDSIYWLNLNGENDGQRATLSLFLNDLKGVGTYALHFSTPIMPMATPKQCRNYMAYVSADFLGDMYVTDPQHTGQVTITAFDYNRHLVSGTFEFTAASPADPGKTIRVTNGRFDTRY